ncbi:MAG TPA: glycosyltransferase family 39 protein [Verrucomicrobiae bacterium]
MKWREPRLALALLILSALTLGCLVPFIGKAVHIDDPLFIWTAHQITSHPLDFYGFKVQWGTHETPIYEVMQNPPLASYYMAVVGILFGWSEIALHFGFLFPAIAAILGTYFVARRFCSHPFAAAFAVIVTPGFLISSTTLMCDIPMVALWLWAIAFWIQGIEAEKPKFLYLSAFLIILCSLTKYFGMCLVPLLLAYSFMLKRRPGRWLLYLCLPVLALAAYQCLTHKAYGRGLLTDAARYVSGGRVGGSLPSKLLAALAFTGGCPLIILPAIPLAWGKKGVGIALGGIVAVVLLIIGIKDIGDMRAVVNGVVNWSFVIQMAILVVGGSAVLILAVADFFQKKDALSLLLLLWVGGTFLFASVVNWTVAGRNILPMIPPVVILLIRRMETREWTFPHLWWPLGISLAVGLLAAQADFQFAGSARTAAYQIDQHLTQVSKDVTFEGHWGFQYYMEQLGAKPLERDPMNLVSNQMIIMPAGNSLLFKLPVDKVESYSTYRCETSKWMAIMNVNLGAGYYSDGWGPAPFIFGAPPFDSYYVFRVK